MIAVAIVSGGAVLALGLWILWPRLRRSPPPDIPWHRDPLGMDDMCSNCGHARWQHHYFQEIGLLCPGDRGWWRD